jgi:hypothetical protein
VTEFVRTKGTQGRVLTVDTVPMPWRHSHNFPSFKVSSLVVYLLQFSNSIYLAQDEHSFAKIYVIEILLR